jgi:Bacterial HORMA domain family 1
MTTSYSFADTFTRANARRLAGRVATDLHQSRILYGQPAAGRVEDYLTELEEMLAGGYLATYKFGFKKDERVLWALRYTVGPDGSLIGNAGGVQRGVDITGGDWFTSLTPSSAWSELSSGARAALADKIPVVRVTGDSPSDSHGYWQADRTYADGGVGLVRETFRSLS